MPAFKSFCFISFEIFYVEFTSRYFIVFVALVNRVFSSTIFSNKLLSLYVKAISF